MSGNAPITDGLEVFEIEVDGDDPRWSKIEPRKYVYCNDDVSIGDFPVRPGKRIVKYVLLPPFAFNPTNQRVIDEISRRNLSRPDRAVTETILDARQAERAQKSIMGVCGVVQAGTDGDSAVGCIGGDAVGRDLYISDLERVWGQHCWFVAVVSE